MVLKRRVASQTENTGSQAQINDVTFAVVRPTEPADARTLLDSDRSRDKWTFKDLTTECIMPSVASRIKSCLPNANRRSKTRLSDFDRIVDANPGER